MGKNKQVTIGGLVYRTGYRQGDPLPIMLHLQHRAARLDLPTWWTPDSAEAMAYSLLKSVELCRRDEAKARKELPPEVAKYPVLVPPPGKEATL